MSGPSVSLSHLCKISRNTAEPLSARQRRKRVVRLASVSWHTRRGPRGEVRDLYGYRLILRRVSGQIDAVRVRWRVGRVAKATGTIRVCDALLAHQCVSKHLVRTSHIVTILHSRTWSLHATHGSTHYVNSHFEDWRVVIVLKRLSKAAYLRERGAACHSRRL